MSEMNDFYTKGLCANGMVLQRNTINCIFGCTKSNSEVTLYFKKNVYTVLSDDVGNWKVEFNPGAAGGPFELTLKSINQSLVFKNIFVGEVWLNSGQSNAQLYMERMRYSYPDEYESLENVNISVITMPISYSFEGPLDYVEKPVWIKVDKENLGEISGLSYFFAKKLWEDLKIPIGIINASQGGSPIASWMSYDSLVNLNKKPLIDRVKMWRNSVNLEKKLTSSKDKIDSWTQEIYKKDLGLIEGWQNISYSELSSQWQKCEIPDDIYDLKKAGVVWFKKQIFLTKEQLFQFESKGANLWLGTILDADIAYVNGVQVGITYYTYPPRRYVVPKGVLKEGENTISIRVQKNGKGPLRFYKEKPYYLFTMDEKIMPVVSRNVEFKLADDYSEFEKTSSGVKIDLCGVWKKRVSLEMEPAPENFFIEWEPTALYNSMLAPTFNHSIAGALWYQGESDAMRYDEYQQMLMEMVLSWRNDFHYAPKEMPFIVVQLPNWADGYKGEGQDVAFDWAELRNAQAKAVDELDNAALVVTIDAGEWNDLHPEKKRTVGSRAAKEALRLAYNMNYNPAPKTNYCEDKDSYIKIKFDCGNTELVAYEIKNQAIDYSKKTKTVYGFSFLFEKDGESYIVPAVANLVSEREIEVEIPKNSGLLLELRYLWANNPELVNLYSKESIPAQPFNISLGPLYR